MLKRICSIFLVLSFVFLLTACGNQTVNTTENTEEKYSAKQEENINKIEPANTEKNDAKKAAVIYFSATGTTEKIAELIADEADADIFKIIPKELYTSEDLRYNNDTCRANREMNNESIRPEISNDLSLVCNYDTIYLGYPIWWGTAPRIIQTFIENYDLSDKPIYTFCTSGSSGIEKSITDLNGLYSDLNIVSGKRFSADNEKAVQEWIKNLK